MRTRLGGCMLLISAEVVAPVTEVVAEVVVAEGWWVGLIGYGVKILGMLLMALASWLVSKFIRKYAKTDAQNQALDALLEGMSKAQDEVVREAKKAAADGKLTKDEITKAKTVAWEHAKLVAKGPAKKIVLEWGSEKVGSLLKQLLSKFKKKK